MNTVSEYRDCIQHFCEQFYSKKEPELLIENYTSVNGLNK